ncbi:MAG: hypothetical protein R3F62_16390 [Planctomycetota bacterium]
MTAVDIEGALALFSDLFQEEASAREFTLREDVSWLQATQRKAGLDRRFDGAKAADVLALPQRPRKPDAAWFAAERAQEVGERVVHAAASASVDGEPVVLVYTNALRGDLELYQRFTVAEVGTGWRRSELKVVSTYVRCGECWDQVSLALSRDPSAAAALPGCDACEGQGWRFANAGHAHGPPVRTGPIRRQAAPLEEAARRVYDAL